MSGTSGTPYAPHTDAETSAMLSAIGVDDEEALFDIPNAVAFDGDFGIESRARSARSAQSVRKYSRATTTSSSSSGGATTATTCRASSTTSRTAPSSSRATPSTSRRSTGILAGAVRVPVDARGAHRAPDRELLDVRRRHCAR